MPATAGNVAGDTNPIGRSRTNQELNFGEKCIGRGAGVVVADHLRPVAGIENGHDRIEVRIVGTEAYSRPAITVRRPAVPHVRRSATGARVIARRPGRGAKMGLIRKNGYAG